MNQMPYDEFVGWTAYFEQRPLDWRNDLRAAYIMNSFGVKKSPQEIFPSLKPLFNATESKDFATSLKASSMFQMMLSATGGDKIAALTEA